MFRLFSHTHRIRPITFCTCQPRYSCKAEKHLIFWTKLKCSWSLLQFIDGGTMISPTAFARRCLCYLMSDMSQEALGDAMQAQVIHPEWPTAFYLQAAALKSLGMENDAEETLKDGACLEARRNRDWKCIVFFFFNSLHPTLPIYINLYLVLSIPSLTFEFLLHQKEKNRMTAIVLALLVQLPFRPWFGQFLYFGGGCNISWFCLWPIIKIVKLRFMI